jgi:hypothetical protein
MLTSTKSNDAPVIFLWKIAHVISVVLWWWYYLRHLCLDDVIKLLYPLYAFIALSFDILHLWPHYMCGKWILEHICYAFGFAPKIGCDMFSLSNVPSELAAFAWGLLEPPTPIVLQNKRGANRLIEEDVIHWVRPYYMPATPMYHKFITSRGRWLLLLIANKNYSKRVFVTVLTLWILVELVE